MYLYPPYRAAICVFTSRGTGLVNGRLAPSGAVIVEASRPYARSWGLLSPLHPTVALSVLDVDDHLPCLVESSLGYSLGILPDCT